jgi:hypothetical protein
MLMDIIDLSKQKIDKSNEIINNVAHEQDIARWSLENEEEKEIQKIKAKYRQFVIDKAKEIQSQADDQKDIINIQQNKITQKTEELNSLDSLEKQELKSVDEKTVNENRKIRIRGNKV